MNLHQVEGGQKSMLSVLFHVALLSSKRLSKSVCTAYIFTKHLILSDFKFLQAWWVWNIILLWFWFVIPWLLVVEDILMHSLTIWVSSFVHIFCPFLFGVIFFFLRCSILTYLRLSIHSFSLCFLFHKESSHAHRVKMFT
jgi:hypothetical protein